MALIASNLVGAAVGVVALVKTTLTGADTMTFKTNALQTLVIDNGSIASVTITIDGDGSTSFNPGGIGEVIDLTAGFQVIVPAGESRAVALRNISRFLAGTVAVNGGGADVKAWVIE